MAHRKPNEKNDHIRSRQFAKQVQDQVPTRHVHVHVVLWDESPDDTAAEGDENGDECPQAGGEGKRV